MAEQIDNTKLFELLDEIIGKLGFGVLLSITIKNETQQTITIQR